MCTCLTLYSYGACLRVKRPGAGRPRRRATLCSRRFPFWQSSIQHHGRPHLPAQQGQGNSVARVTGPGVSREESGQDCHASQAPGHHVAVTLMGDASSCCNSAALCLAGAGWLSLASAADGVQELPPVPSLLQKDALSAGTQLPSCWTQRAARCIPQSSSSLSRQR